MKTQLTRFIGILAFVLFVIPLMLTNLAYADEGGRFLIPELPNGTIIDPTDCSDSDWPTDVLDIRIESLLNPGTVLGTGKMVISHSDDLMADEELYLYIQIEDNDSSSDDLVVIMFDNSHDEDPPDVTSYEVSDDRGFRFKRDGTVMRVYGEINTSSDYAAFDDTRNCVQGFGGGNPTWEIEAKILPEDLGLNGFSSLAGAAMFSSDPDSGTDPIGQWPNTNVTETQANWVNLLSRPPIDYILLIDQSGSMSGDKWTSAKKAGDNFALILSKLNDPDLNDEYMNLDPPMDGDRLGLTTFTWKSGAAETPTVIGLTSIPSSPSDYISGELDSAGLSPGGSTPIIAGVNHTFNMFGGAANLPDLPPRTRVVMLLSDGKHNTPTSEITISDFDYNANLCSEESLVQINTVAIGTDSTVSTDKLDDIKDCFSGNVIGDGTSTATENYNITGFSGITAGKLAANLTKFFVQTLEPSYNWNIINDNGADFPLNAGEHKLLLFAFWGNSDDAVDLTIITPTGGQTGTSDTDLGYSYLLIDNPAEGNYKNFIALGAMMKMVLVDLRLEGRFGVDNKPQGTSSTITLRTRLREDGAPILGADVRVNIARPEEGFGTVASTISPNDCASSEPSLPPVDPSFNMDIVGTVATTTGSATASASAQHGDVDAPHFVLMRQILEGCGKNDLARAEDSGLRLYDDETHGDAVANDGLYTLTYTNTEIEGSYVFRFRATGTTSNGQMFSRVRELAEYIRVDVDPGSTEFDSRIVQQVGFNIIEEYYIIPRDAHGEYLGPGHSDQIEFIVSEAVKLGGVRDYNNGIYSQTIKYNENQDKPVVTAVVQGKELKPKAVKPFELVLFAGRFFFDNSLGIDDGTVVGARLGYRLTNSFTIELESGVTFTETTTGDSGEVIQALINVRYDVHALRAGRWLPYVTTGAGYVFFRGFGMDDEAPAVHGGVGSTLELWNSFGIRVDGRVFQIGSAMNAGATTNPQVTGGLVFRF